MLLLNISLIGKTGRKWASFSAASFPCPLGCFKCCCYWISKRTRNNRWWPQSPSGNCGGNVKGYNNIFTRYKNIFYNYFFKVIQFFLLLLLEIRINFLMFSFSFFFFCIFKVGEFNCFINDFFRKYFRKEKWRIMA